MTTLAPPDRSLEQRRTALLKANEYRIARANLKKDLKAGRVSVYAVLMRPPVFAETMRVWDVLMALPKVGRVKTVQILKDAGVAPSKTLSGVSVRQRKDLATVIAMRWPGGRA